jgi:DNA-binding transcriptional LysR family regulator
VNEVIDVKVKRMAIVLSESLDYSLAAKTLGISTAELRQQITKLEDRLCLHVFEPESLSPELTYEGRFLIAEFRKAVALSGGP